MKVRADLLVTKKDPSITRTKAKALIMSGDVYLKEVRINKAGELIDEELIEDLVIKEKDNYVSRGAYKLLGAIDKWDLDFTNKVCMDVGASTGGFTHVMLLNGASRVYSVDVGYGQLHYMLRSDDRVVVLEKENVRYLEREKIDDEIDFMSMDISFISIKKVLDNCFKFLKEDAEAVLLIKPQFESEKSRKTKGVIKSKEIHKEVLEDMIDYFKRVDKNVIDLYYSPIKGPKGNREFLVYLKNSSWEGFDYSLIDKVIDESHEVL